MESILGMELSMIFGSRYDVVIAVGAGLVLGGIAAGLWVKMRLRAVLERNLAAMESEKALILEKLRMQIQAGEDLRDRLNQSEENVHRYQSLSAELNSVKAALEARIQRIPVLEKELETIKTSHDALQNDLRKESAALAQAVEKGLQLEKMEGEKYRKEEQIQTLQDQAAQSKAEIAELRTVLDEERKQADEKIAERLLEIAKSRVS